MRKNVGPETPLDENHCWNQENVISFCQNVGKLKKKCMYAVIEIVLTPHRVADESPFFDLVCHL